MPTTDHVADGDLETRDGEHILRFERRFDHPIERVWAALTEPEELVAWLADADVDLVKGGRIELRWLNTDDQGNSAVLHGTITELEPLRVIEYLGDIHGRLRWELRRDGNGCVLTFTSTLPAPNEWLVSSLAGWDIHLDHLAAALDGRSVDWPNWWADYFGAWSKKRDRYAAKVG